MKKLIVTTLALSLLVPAFAQANESTSLPVSQSAELSAVFDNSGDDLQVTVLSEQEMKDIQGVWIPQAAGGIMEGIGGHLGCMSYAISNGNYNPGIHLATVAGDAAAGVFNPILGSTTMINGLRSTAVGVALVRSMGTRIKHLKLFI